MKRTMLQIGDYFINLRTVSRARYYEEVPPVQDEQHDERVTDGRLVRDQNNCWRWADEYDLFRPCPASLDIMFTDGHIQTFSDKAAEGLREALIFAED